MLIGFASAGSYGIPLVRQQVDGHTAHPTGRTSDQHRPLLRAGAIALHGQQTHGCRKAGRAQGHGVKGGEHGWYLDDPGGWHTDIYGVATKGSNAQVITSHEDP